MFRRTLLLAVLIPVGSFAQTSNAPSTSSAQQVVQGQAQSANAGAAQAPQRRQLPFADMMTTWEYAPIEWK
jgi:hypothetical protein